MSPSDTLQLVNRTKSVAGWLSREAGLLIAWIDSVQESQGVTGDLFEIGVHHGKSAVLLASMARGQEKLGVCDLFDMQGDNVSVSGLGDRQIFESNVDRYALRKPPIEVHQCLSDALTPEQIGSGYRLFHVDGGHNADEALGDLRLAAETLHEQGVIVVDDAFRHEWPGVIEAINQFLQERPDYCPLVTGFNKLLITRTDCAEVYTRSLDEAATRDRFLLGYPWRYKTLPFLGHGLRIFYLFGKDQDKSIGMLRAQHRLRATLRKLLGK